MDKLIIYLAFLTFASIAKGGHVNLAKVKIFLDHSIEDGTHQLIYSILNEGSDFIKVIGDVGIHHHSYLVITKDGSGVEGFNITSVMSMPINSTYLTIDKLVKLASGEKRRISHIKLYKGESKTYQLEWGVHRFNLLPGKYDFQVILPKTDGRYYSDSKWIEDKSIFTDKIESNTVSLKLE